MITAVGLGIEPTHPLFYPILPLSATFLTKINFLLKITHGPLPEICETRISVFDREEPSSQ